MKFIGVVVVGLFALLFTRLWSIQVLNGRRYEDLAVATTERVVPEPAPRGLIVSRSGRILAGDVALEEIKMSEDAAQAHPRSIANLAMLLAMSVRHLDAEVSSNQYNPYQSVPLVTNPSPEAIAYMAQHPSEFPGIKVTTAYVRRYPAGDVGAQMLGYVGPITASELKADVRLDDNANSVVGQAGLEEEYDQELQGRAGKNTEEVNALGDAVKTVSRTPSRVGDTLVTHLSLGLEDQLQSDLANQVAALRGGTTASGAVPAPWAAGVVLDARDGAVLAMASYPTYNDNDWIPAMSSVTYDTLAHEEGEPFNNYALVGAEAPGSTFKLATATAALDDGLITAGYSYVDPGSFTLPTGQVLSDAPGDTGGDFDIASALSYSSDVFFYNLGELFYDQSVRYGATPIQNVAREYGLGEPSGIDLPNVNDGQVDSLGERTLLHRTDPGLYGPPTWYVGDNVEMAFGQGETLVTPLEIANAYATFANGGTRYAPQVAAAIESPNGKVVRRVAPKVMGRVSLPASTYQALLAGFKGAVSSPIGTAYSDFLGFDFNTWNLAGKTGTATTSNATQPVSWFVAFGGPKGQPAKYAFCVEIDEAGYGADAAAPVVRELAGYLMAHPLSSIDLLGTRSKSHS